MRPAILLIDDDPAIVDSLVILLERHGYRVSHEHSGSSGLQMLQSDRYGVVLCDMYRPGLHGVELIAAIRRGDPAVAIIAISGSLQGAAGRSLEAALLAGADHLLDKPFDAVELLAATELVAGRAERTALDR